MCKFIYIGRLAQLVRASHLHCEGLRFEPSIAHFVRDTEKNGGPILPPPIILRNFGNLGIDTFE